MAESSWGPFVACLMSADIEQAGIGYVVIARRKSSETIRCVIFLVDVWCLGVKDCVYQKCGEFELGTILEGLSVASELIAVEPSYAKKFLEDAVAYARGIGFNPHADFSRYFNSLSDVDSHQCNDIFSFGKDGKPLYIQGPNDRRHDVARIMNTLEATLGADGFQYLLEEIE